MTRNAKLPSPLPLTGMSGSGRSGSPVVLVLAFAEPGVAALCVCLCLMLGFLKHELCQLHLPDVLASGWPSCRPHAQDKTAGCLRREGRRVSGARDLPWERLKYALADTREVQGKLDEGMLCQPANGMFNQRAPAYGRTGRGITPELLDRLERHFSQSAVQ